jgi:hypothetical protein
MGGVVDNTLGTNIFGSNSTDRAMGAQTQGTTRANDAILDSYKQQQGYLNPYKNAGASSLKQLSSGSFKNNFEGDPGYQFRLGEGMKALQGSAAAKGSLNSGATMKALTRYGQDFASNEYGKFYDREYNRLSQLTGMGNQASTNLAGMAGDKGVAIGNNYMGLGNAQAAAQIGQADRQAQMMSQGMQSGATMAMFSDERLKKNIRAVSKEDLKELKDAINPVHFEYISEEFGEGEWIGIIAQDIAKTKLGKIIVSADESGNLKVDLKKLLSLLVINFAKEAA